MIWFLFLFAFLCFYQPSRHGERTFGLIIFMNVYLTTTKLFFLSCHANLFLFFVFVFVFLFFCFFFCFFLFCFVFFVLFCFFFFSLVFCFVLFFCFFVFFFVPNDWVV